MDNIRFELRSLGLTVPDENHGLITSFEIGVEAEFKWDRIEEVLFIQINQKPFFIPCNIIFSRLEAAINHIPPPQDDIDILM